MSRMVSPQEVYDQPSRWLDVPHALHESAGALMKLLFPDWLERTKLVHCYLCEGRPLEPAIDRTTGALVVITGEVTNEQGEAIEFRVE